MTSKCCCLLVVLMTVACHVLPSPSQGAAISEAEGVPVEHLQLIHARVSELKAARRRDGAVSELTQEQFMRLMNKWPSEWCYRDENVQNEATEEQMLRLARTNSPQMFEFQNVVTPSQIIEGVLDRGTTETVLRLYRLGGAAIGKKNAGMYVVKHVAGSGEAGVRLLLKAMYNEPRDGQDSAKSITREAYMQAVAAHATRVEDPGSPGPPPGVVPAVHFAGLENVWNPRSFLVMDYIDPLEQLHKQPDGKYRMKDLEFLTVAQSLTGVVSRMLRAGVSHNHIELSNVIILKNHQVAVIDFGESCLLSFAITQERDYRERVRFSCHPFSLGTRSPKRWVNDAVHQAGHRDVRSAFSVLRELLTEFTEGISDAYKAHVAGILTKALEEEDSPWRSIYDHLMGKRLDEHQECTGLVIPKPEHLDPLHGMAHAKTEQALVMLTRVAERMRISLAGLRRIHRRIQAAQQEDRSRGQQEPSEEGAVKLPVLSQAQRQEPSRRRQAPSAAAEAPVKLPNIDVKRK